MDKRKRFELLCKGIVISRLKKEKDLDEIIELGNRCAGFNTGTDADHFYSKETLIRWVKDPNSVLLVATHVEELAGFVLGSYLTGPRGAYIHCIEVKAEYREMRIGTELLKFAKDEFRKMGGVHIFSNVSEDNLIAISCHKKAGFLQGKKHYYMEAML